MKAILLACILSVSVTVFAAPKMGPTVSGGGNTCLLNIHSASETLQFHANRLTTLAAAGVNWQEFNAKLAAVKFETGFNLMKDGRKVDGLNYPYEMRIVVDQDSCLRIFANQSSLFAFLVHETLGLLQKDDKDYKISKLVLNEFQSFFAEPVPASGGASLVLNGDESMLVIEGEVAKQIYIGLNVPETSKPATGTTYKSGKHMTCTKTVRNTGPEYKCVTGLETTGSSGKQFTGTFVDLN